MTTPVQPPDRAATLVLASTSPYRRRLLARLVAEFDAAAPAFDEETAKARLRAAGAGPRDLARALARGKAEAVAAERPGAFVLGGDQLVALGDEVLGKPGDAAGARAQLARLAGRTHALVTAFAVVLPDGTLREHVDVTHLTLLPLTAAEVAAYVALDEPYDCAGSYKIEEHGVGLLAAVETADATAIEGLPLLALGRTLRGLGLAAPGLAPRP